MPALGDLAAGTHATVTAIAGDPALVQRLYELGLIEGERVELIGFAPFGDPLEVRIGSTRLSLRKREAAAVTVTAD